MGRLTWGHWGIFPVSETLRQAEGKPEDPLQALALPACGNPLLPGWEDPEAEGGYQMLRNHLSNPPAAFLLGLACGHQGCLRTSGTAPWFVAFCAVIVFYPESQGAYLASTSQAQRAFKPWVLLPFRMRRHQLLCSCSSPASLVPSIETSPQLLQTNNILRPLIKLPSLLLSLTWQRAVGM